jgi:hypothetical protein
MLLRIMSRWLAISVALCAAMFLSGPATANTTVTEYEPGTHIIGSPSDIDWP